MIFIRDDLLSLVNEMQADFSSMKIRYSTERDRMKVLLESEPKVSTLQSSNVGITASLRQSLNAALRQNADLRTRLARIHGESDLGDVAAMATTPQLQESLPRGMNPSLSYSSSCISEFFDAREYVASEEDSEDESESGSAPDSINGDNDEEDDAEDMFIEATANINNTARRESVTPMSDRGGTLTGRRRTLPVPKPETEGVNLWNLLCKNIGKDLSKISMPVTLVRFYKKKTFG